MAWVLGYLGPSGSHTEAASTCLIPWLSQPVILRSWPSLPSLLASLCSTQADIVVLPFENALEGSVTEVLEGLHETNLQAIAEFSRPVIHSLLAKPGTLLSDIREVLSHPQGLGQCRVSLATHLPYAQTLATASTSEAARQVAESTSIHKAALASPQSGRHYGLQPMIEQMSDNPDNETRFLLVARPDLQESVLVNNFTTNASSQKTSIRVDVGDYPGSLLDVLIPFRTHGLNLSKIESRPDRQGMGRYRFYMDVMADLRQHSEVVNAIQSAGCRYIHMLTPYVCLGRLQ